MKPIALRSFYQNPPLGKILIQFRPHLILPNFKIQSQPYFPIFPLFEVEIYQHTYKI
jgi:hypothetical protein